MSSPTVVIFQPALLIFFRRDQHGEIGLAAGAGESGGDVGFFAVGRCAPISSMCSAIHPCCWPRKLAMRSARHFLPSRALPP